MKEKLKTTFRWEVERVTYENEETAYLAWVVKETEYIHNGFTLDDSFSIHPKIVTTQEVKVYSTRHGVLRNLGRNGFYAQSESDKPGRKFFLLEEAKYAAESACKRADERFRANNIIHREIVS